VQGPRAEVSEPREPWPLRLPMLWEGQRLRMLLGSTRPSLDRCLLARAEVRRRAGLSESMLGSRCS